MRIFLCCWLDGGRIKRKDKDRTTLYGGRSAGWYGPGLLSNKGTKCQTNNKNKWWVMTMKVWETVRTFFILHLFSFINPTWRVLISAWIRNVVRLYMQNWCLLFYRSASSPHRWCLEASPLKQAGSTTKKKKHKKGNKNANKISFKLKPNVTFFS